MQKVYFMIGVPGAGKTTYATTELSHAVYLGTDAIRKELFGKELTLRGHRKVHQLLHQRLLLAISAGKDVVIDCTNTTKKRRKVLLNLLPSHCMAIAVFMDTPLHRALKQNHMRDRHVPVLGICSMWHGLSVPVKEEGFEEILRVRPEVHSDKIKQFRFVHITGKA